MAAVGRIYVDEKNINSRKTPFINIIKTNKILNRFLKNTQETKNCLDIDIINVAIPVISKYHINKAIEYLAESDIHNIIIQDYLKEYINENCANLDKKIVEETMLKEAGLYYAIARFLKSSFLPISESEILIICDDFINNKLHDVFLDTKDFVLNLSLKCQNITLLSRNSDMFMEFENLILDDTGLCPICTSDFETAVSQRPNIIINFSQSSLDQYADEKMACKLFNRYISQDSIIFDLNMNNKWKHASLLINNYDIIPPKRYRDFVPIKEFAKFTGSIFDVLCPDIDIGRIRSRNDIRAYKYFLEIFKEKGFDVRIKKMLTN